MSNSNQGSFVTGFSLGLFAGAIGYFLFATDKGAKVRDELNEEWEKVRSELNQSNITDLQAPSIGETVKAALTKLATEFESQAAIKLETKTDSKKNKDKAKKTSKKFKGV